MRSTYKVLACLIALLLALPLPGRAQQGAPAAPFRAEELDQLAAPVALYPDPLLAQILMASSYPLEVVQAARFAKANPGLKGAQLDEALKKETWDDSVKSLVGLPEVLGMMDAKLGWTQKLGDAFLAQQKELMEAVQRLRARAQAEGNLKSTAEQKVTVEPAAPAAPAPPPPTVIQQAPPSVVVQQAPAQVVVQQAPPTVIRIEPANPQIVYVPTYNPTVVYGAWPYPAYPPYAYYPPGYVAGVAMFSFAAGVAVGGALWGNCNWHGGNVNVNVNQYNSYTRNVNTVNVAQTRTQIQGGRQDWQHQPEHRKGSQYRDPATQQRYNKGVNPQATQARESFRGRAEQGRQEMARGGAGQISQGGAGNRAGSAPPRSAGTAPGGGAQRGGAQGAAPGAATRPSGAQPGGGNFQGAAPGAATRPGAQPGGGSFQGSAPGAATRPSGAQPGGGSFQGSAPGAATRPSGAQSGGGNFQGSAAGAGGQFRGGGSGGAGAFEGLGQGRSVQQYSSRGQASRQSMGAAPAAGAQGGGARGGAGRRR